MFDKSWLKPPGTLAVLLSLTCWRLCSDFLMRQKVIKGSKSSKNTERAIVADHSQFLHAPCWHRCCKMKNGGGNRLVSCNFCWAQTNAVKNSENLSRQFLMDFSILSSLIFFIWEEFSELCLPQQGLTYCNYLAEPLFIAKNKLLVVWEWTFK